MCPCDSASEFVAEETDWRNSAVDRGEFLDDAEEGCEMRGHFARPFLARQGADLCIGATSLRRVFAGEVPARQAAPPAAAVQGSVVEGLDVEALDAAQPSAQGRPLRASSPRR